jgi:hypothetical protein
LWCALGRAEKNKVCAPIRIAIALWKFCQKRVKE